VKKLIIVLCLLVLCGCQDEQKFNEKGNLPQTWVDVYGTGPDSKLQFNLAKHAISVNKQLGSIEQRVVQLEDACGVSSDPNDSTE